MAEKKILKIGVVGCGGIATYAHCPAYAKMDNVKIVAFCDIVPDKAENMVKYGVSKCKEFGTDTKIFADAHCYTDFDEFIKDPEIESVDLCVPNYLHSVFAVKALDAGKHVFSEKPDAVGVDEVTQMNEAHIRNNKTLMVMRNNRYEDRSMQIKKMVENGEFGDIYCGRCGWIRRRGIPGKGGWFTTKAQSGGGPLIDLGVHMIDLSIWLMGNPTPVSVSGCTFSKFANDDAESSSDNSKFGETSAEGTFDVEDLAMGFIKFDNGACLQIEFSWASNIGEGDYNFVELRGSKAGCKWVNGGTAATVFTEKDGKLVDIPVESKCTVGGHEACLRHYVDVVLNGTKPIFVPQQGIDMIKILRAMYTSAETGKEVRL